MPGTLYLLPSSLGPGDWQTTHPAATQTIACRLDHFFVENAKSARAELKKLGYERALREVVMVELPREEAATDWNGLLAPLRNGKDAGLMSEAGCPAVADPGALLVRAAHDAGIRVAPLVGPSAILLGLMASGLNGQSFAFHGYLPVQEAQRRGRIVALEQESRAWRRTQLFIETPYRNAALFSTLLSACQPDTLLCVAAALTTPDERISTRTIARWRTVPPPRLDRIPVLFLLLAGN